MRKQLTASINDENSFDLIRKAKKGARKIRLRNIKLKIYEAYTNFIANGNDLGVMIPIPLGSIQKKDMQHCYTSNTVGLHRLKKAIRDNHNSIDRELCPYCGVREPCEFDHFLPKSKFQEFSVFSKNLIWSCHRCNNKKKEGFGSANRFFNTYLDVLPEEQFLFCRVGVPFADCGVSFYLKKPNSFSVSQFSVIESHVKNLELCQIYEQRASQKLPAWVKKWRILAESYDLEELKIILMRDMDTEIQVDIGKYGQNHFKSVLKTGIKDHLNDLIESFYK